MNSKYSQVFSLEDLFENETVKNKLPFLQSEGNDENEDVLAQNVFQFVKVSAKSVLNNFNASYIGNSIVLDVGSDYELDSLVDKIYDDLLLSKSNIETSILNHEIIESAVNESKSNRRRYGINSKLYLKAQSVQQISGMNEKQIEELINNILENIYFGDNFPQTQKKFNLSDLKIYGRHSYEERKKQWKQMVGDE